MSTLSHPSIVDGWFYEKSPDWPGQALGLRVDTILHIQKSQYQDVLVFKSTDYGNVLVLDGVIQATERDEFAYQEMITHIPLMCHPNPKKVLVVGGGDGGVLREIAKHKTVETIDIVEIDDLVVKLSKQFLPAMAKGYDDPRVTLHITDGFEYLKGKRNEYDVIISDTSDPEGPAEVLFQEKYFRLLHDSLTSNGIAAMQASENVWLKLQVLKDLKATCKKVFPTVEYSSTCVPTYTSGQLGLMICSKDPQQKLDTPVRFWEAQEEASLNTYYNQHIHKASFVVPTFAQKYIYN